MSKMRFTKPLKPSILVI